MTLKDLLNAPEPDDARRTRTREPEVQFQGGQPSEVVLPALRAIPEDEAAWRNEISRVTGLNIPEHRQVHLKSVRFWGDQSAPYVYARFDITDRPDAVEAVDGVAILKELRSAKRSVPRRTEHGTNTFVLSFNDWQVGMIGGGGTEAFVNRIHQAFENAVARVKELRKLGRNVGELLILGLGDLIDGCGMRSNHAFELDLDRRGQVNVVVACILHGLDTLAPMFSRVRVLAVGGNHGENRLDYKYTTLHDNDDNAVFEHAARAVERDRRLSHVEFYIAQDALSKTIEVNGWVLGITHGQVYGKGSGGSIEAKVAKWFSGQAAGRQPVGDSDLLITAHYHHLQVKDHGAWAWVQAPALDGGSAWFTNMSGQHSAPGMLSFVVTDEKRMRDLEVL